MGYGLWTMGYGLWAILTTLENRYIVSPRTTNLYHQIKVLCQNLRITAKRG